MRRVRTCETGTEMSLQVRCVRQTLTHGTSVGSSIRVLVAVWQAFSTSKCVVNGDWLFLEFACTSKILIEDRNALSIGARVCFKLYADDDGIGASEVRHISEKTTEPSCSVR